MGPVVLALILVIAVSPVREWLTGTGAPVWLSSRAPGPGHRGPAGHGGRATLSIAQLAVLIPTYSDQINRLVATLQRWAAGLGYGSAEINRALESLDPGQAAAARPAAAGRAARRAVQPVPHRRAAARDEPGRAEVRAHPRTPRGRTGPGRSPALLTFAAQGAPLPDRLHLLRPHLRGPRRGRALHARRTAAAAVGHPRPDHELHPEHRVHHRARRRRRCWGCWRAACGR